MVLQLHVWGPAFGLPSIDAECIAAIAYLNRIVPHSEWKLVANHDTAISPRNEFPVLIDGSARIAGFAAIVSHLRNHRSGAYDLDYHLTHRQQTDRVAFISFLQSTAGPLVDLSLYISSENYNSTTSSAYTAILPWYLNYTVPPARRDVARSRTAHLGLSSLDVNTVERNGSEPGGQSLHSDFEAAKRDAGIPVEDRQSNTLNMGRKKGVGGLLSSPIYAARFKLDALTNELLDPLAELLEKKDYLLEGGKPSSLDCLAFGYLALMFFPPVPQAWLKEALQSRFPRIVRYINRMREELLGGDMNLPWGTAAPRPLLYTVGVVAHEWTSHLPILSSILQKGVIIQSNPRKPSKKIQSSLLSPLFTNTLLALLTMGTATLAGLAIHHRRNPREGNLIFWAMRSQAGGLGEAGDLLKALANGLPPLS